MKKERKYLLILAFLSLLTCFSVLWFPEVDLMESRNFITSREILKNNEWLVTTLNGDYRFEKPPLPSWLTASVMHLTNNFFSPWILRLPSAITAFISVFYMYFFAKRLSKNSYLSFLISLVYTSTFMITKIGGKNTWDFYPYAFIFMCIYHLLVGIEENRRVQFILSGVFLGLSIMSKGPVAPYGMLLPFVISYGIFYGKDGFIRNWKNLLFALIVSIVIAGFWPFMMIANYRELFFSVLKKEQGTWSTRHTQPAYFYLSYPLFTGIWMLFSVAVYFKKFLTEKMKSFSQGFQIYKFSMVWMILSFVLLSFVGMKKERYGLPIYMISSIPVGLLGYWYSNNKWNTLDRFSKILAISQYVLNIILAIAVPVIFLFKGYRSAGGIYTAIMVILFLPIAFLLLKNFRKRSDFLIENIAAISGLLFILVSLSSNWYIDRFWKNSYSKDMQYLNSLQQNVPTLPIYSQNVDIMDVWKVGKSIKETMKTDEYPDEFYYLEQEYGSDFDFSPYLILDKTTYQKSYGDKGKVVLYHLKKNENK